jgi:hypothetical protein
VGRHANDILIVAMLVGSIGWSKKPGDKIVKGEELGWFQVGYAFFVIKARAQNIVWRLDNHNGLSFFDGNPI